MKKSLKYLFIIFIIFFSALFIFCRVLEYQIIKKTPDILNALRTPLGTLTTDDISRDSSCFFKVCICLNNITLYRSGHPKQSLGDLKIIIPPAWPLFLHLKTKASDNPFRLDADLSFNEFHIRTLQGQFGNFSFNITGKINTKQETGQLLVQTIGLKSFIQSIPNLSLPDMFYLVISDKPQTITLIPKNDFLTIQGIPLIPLFKE